VWDDIYGISEGMVFSESSSAGPILEELVPDPEDDMQDFRNK
jgi:hypothetical protein